MTWRVLYKKPRYLKKHHTPPQGTTAQNEHRKDTIMIEGDIEVALEKTGSKIGQPGVKGIITILYLSVKSVFNIHYFENEDADRWLHVSQRSADGFSYTFIRHCRTTDYISARATSKVSRLFVPKILDIIDRFLLMNHQSCEYEVEFRLPESESKTFLSLFSPYDIKQMAKEEEKNEMMCTQLAHMVREDTERFHYTTLIKVELTGLRHHTDGSIRVLCRFTNHTNLPYVEATQHFSMRMYLDKQGHVWLMVVKKRPSGKEHQVVLVRLDQISAIKDSFEKTIVYILRKGIEALLLRRVSDEIKPIHYTMEIPTLMFTGLVIRYDIEYGDGRRSRTMTLSTRPKVSVKGKKRR